MIKKGLWSTCLACRLWMMCLGLYALLPTLLQGQDRGNFAEFEMDQLSIRSSRSTALGATDSLYVEVIGGQKYLRHKIQPGQTLYSIKRFYAVDLTDLYASNSGLEANGLSVGEWLRIPLVDRALERYGAAQYMPQEYIPVYYQVCPHETLYRIARVYFRLPAEVLRERNRLLSDGLYPTQILHIGWISRKGIPDSLRTLGGLPGVLGEESQKNKYRYEALLNSKNERLVQGTACWDKAMDLADQNKLYVLCSLVPQGGVVRLENPMTNRRLYARVVAPKPENSLTQNSIVMLTPTVARALGGLDARFYVKVYYCKQ